MGPCADDDRQGRELRADAGVADVVSQLRDGFIDMQAVQVHGALLPAFAWPAPSCVRNVRNVRNVTGRT